MLDKKILFVDDSPTMRRIIANSLKKIGFKEFFEAENGQDALDKIDEQPIDIVLTDWNMPEMNGEELVKNLRNHNKYKDMPILMITTRGMQDDVINAVKIGVNGYVVKPFTSDVLKKKLIDIIK
jgi:two-component system, chemotaxis family, chemotaxis protein CheY